MRHLLTAVGLLCTILLIAKTKWVRGTHDGEEGHFEIGKRLYGQLINEWHQLYQIGICNWYTFTLIYIYGEIDDMTRNYELTLTLLGFGVYVRYDYDSAHSPMRKMADEAYAEILAKERESTDSGDFSPFDDK